MVCADAAAVRARYGIDNAIGDYEGRLAASGERVTLVNHVGIVVQNIRYRDSGKWPAGPDGTGHSLVLRSVYLDPGDAVRHLSDALRAKHADLPWAQIIGMRNILVHDYFGIDLEAVWSTVIQNLPDLRRKMEAILTEVERPPD